MRVLVVDDNQEMRLNLKDQLERPYPAGSTVVHQVFTASERESALEILDREPIDVAFIDLDLGPYQKGAGLELLSHIRKKHQKIVPIMITGAEDEETISKAYRLGVADFIMKPFDESLVHKLILKAIPHQRIFRNKQVLRAQAGDRAVEPIFLKSKNPQMADVLEQAKRLAGKGLGVFISGEPGVGKEVIARYLWTLENDEDRAFIAVNCGALPENLVESELFGHRAGAFTGADKDKAGKFEIAEGGDIFLDEVGTMTLATQVKLLRVLQEKQIEPLGAGRYDLKNIDVRIIAATNENLEEAILEKRFRSDLYYRLRVVTLEIPPLRERKEDIPDLVCDLLRKNKYPNKFLSKQSMELCLAYDWPGNVRLLENTIVAEAALCDGNEITEDRLRIRLGLDRPAKGLARSNAQLKSESTVPVFSLSSAEIEGRFENVLEDTRKAMVQHALDNAINTTQAAKLLGMHRNSLVRKLREWGWNQPGTDAAVDRIDGKPAL